MPLSVKPVVSMYPSIRSLCRSLLFAPFALAQHNASTANGCDDGYFPGTDTVIFTTPYTYSQVMSIIGSFRNITWSGSPYDSVTLNGTDNTVGTARTYDIDGRTVSWLAGKTTNLLGTQVPTLSRPLPCIPSHQMDHMMRCTYSHLSQFHP